jgi:predicted N-acetyltransferase YhbS
MHIRKEQPNDIDTIYRLTETAFLSESHSSHTEQYIVNALRATGQLTLSLVAEENDIILGHVALSPVTISSGAAGWYGLGPVSVWPDRQQQGIGSELIEAALAELRQLDAVGCVVLGNPGYYGRFGFNAHADLVLPGVPAEYFQILPFGSELPGGIVSYSEAFAAGQ